MGQQGVVGDFENDTLTTQRSLFLVLHLRNGEQSFELNIKRFRLQSVAALAKEEEHSPYL